MIDHAELTLNSTIELANGVLMPRLGLGTYKTTDGQQVRLAVESALQTGYRSIDTASLYGNEVGVGEAIAASGLPRQDIFLTTKVWNDDQGHESTHAALAASLERLGTSYVDLYLVHWPIEQLLEPTWRAMEESLSSGMVRAIGVCNFMQYHLERLLQVAEVAPMIDQYECHPMLQQPSLRRFCVEHGIVVEAWAPLLRGHVAEMPVLVDVADEHGVTPEQVALRWALQHDTVVIPKSVHPERIVQNADVFGFTLDAAAMARIDAADIGRRLGRDPDTMAW